MQVSGRLRLVKSKSSLFQEPVEVWTYRENIGAGFIETYRLLLNHRDLFLKLGYTKFANDEIRVSFPRYKVIWIIVPKRVLHPDVLRNALNRDRLFNRLLD